MVLLLPELRVDLQGLGQHLGTGVTHGVAADVQRREAGVAAQGAQQDVGSQLEARLGHGQGLEGLGGRRGGGDVAVPITRSPCGAAATRWGHVGGPGDGGCSVAEVRAEVGCLGVDGDG